MPLTTQNSSFPRKRESIPKQGLKPELIRKVAPSQVSRFDQLVLLCTMPLLDLLLAKYCLPHRRMLLEKPSNVPFRCCAMRRSINGPTMDSRFRGNDKGRAGILKSAFHSLAAALPLCSRPRQASMTGRRRSGLHSFWRLICCYSLTDRN